MEQSKIDRINFLARKSRAEGLTEAEAKEQKKLRAEYVAAFKKILFLPLNQQLLKDQTELVYHLLRIISSIRN